MTTTQDDAKGILCDCESHKKVRECVQHGGTVWINPFLCDKSYEIASGMSDPCWSQSS